MDNEPLQMTGDLLNGGTTAEAQEAFLRDNHLVIREAVAPRYRERTRALVDLIMPRIVEIGDWRRRPVQVLREIIKQVQFDEKQAAHLRSTITTRGRPPGSTRPAASKPTGVEPNQVLPTASPPPTKALSPLPVTMSSDDGIEPKPGDSISSTPVSATLFALSPPTSGRPRISTIVSGQALPGPLKDLLMAYVKREPEADLLGLYAKVDQSWWATDLPKDIRTALEWIHERSR